MKNYGDWETLELVMDQDSTGDFIHADLRKEALWALDDHEPWELWQARAYNQETIEVLWCPKLQLAGIAWGADAQWTDAESVDDALKRFFSVDGKEMSL